MIKGLSAENEEERLKATLEADKFIAKTTVKKSVDSTGVNRTVINKNAYKNDRPSDVIQEGVPAAQTDQGIHQGPG